MLKKDKLAKISIIIPSFNKGKYIAKTLDSIVKQNYPNLEVLVYDGGSTDQSLKILAKYCQKHHYIKLVSKKDQGQLDAINRGFKKAKGDILAYINADDLYRPNVFEKVAQTFRNYPNTNWVTGYGEVIDEKDKKIARAFTLYKNRLIKLNSYPLLIMVNYLTQPATFISKKAYRKYGPLKGHNKIVMEYELWLKLGKVKMPIIINETLAAFRLTKTNLSFTHYDEILFNDNHLIDNYTKNRILISLHRLHNQGRKFIASR